MKAVPLKERFMTKFAVAPDTGCWVWTASKRTPSGYGQIGVGNKPRPAHRVSWELFHGEIPSGLSVCHKCDNPSCVNPEHLFLGTPLDNKRDSMAKGRSRKAKAKPPFIRKVKSLQDIAAAKGLSVRECVEQALSQSQTTHAAGVLLGISHTSIVNAVNRYGLDRPRRVRREHESRILLSKNGSEILRELCSITGLSAEEYFQRQISQYLEAQS